MQRVFVDAPLSALLLLLCIPIAVASPLEDAVRLYQARQYNEVSDVLIPVAVAGNPDEAEASRWLGKAARKQNQAGDAVRWLEKAVGLKPREASYWVDLGDAYGLMAKQASVFEKLDWARKCDRALGRAVELAPADFAARSALVDFCLEAPEMAGGGRKRALAEARALKELNVSGGAVLEALLFEKEKRWDESLAVLRDAIGRMPEDYVLLYTLGRTAVLAGRTESDAKAALEKCLGLEPPAGFPGHGAVWYRLGDLSRLNGDREAARVGYETALRLDPALEPAKQALDGLDAAADR
ncbi:MAG: hypothetical protein SFV32_13055 [Opitutaceae bacterium]|nr:hypothetical protein [Opitutaceae bacterium]